MTIGKGELNGKVVDPFKYHYRKWSTGYSDIMEMIRLDFRRSLEFGYPPREEAAGRVNDRLCLWRKFKI